MAQQTINVGAAPNDGTGDPLQTAFTKGNANFTELYARAALSSPQGRLTLQVATPVMITTQSGKIIIYYTPYVGDQVPIYDGTNMAMTTFSELAISIYDTIKSPAAIGASKVNDWFVWSDAGTLRLSHGPDWTSDTARSAGTALVMVNGTWTNAVAITNGPAISRGTYVGSTRSNASSTLDWIYGGLAAGGTAGVFYVWNAYNRVLIATMVQNSTASWTYATADWRNTNASATMRVSYVAGLAEEAIAARYSCNISSGGGSIAVGLDSSTVASGTANYVVPGAGNNNNTTAFYEGVTGLGAHFVQAIEFGPVSTTFLGQTTTSGDIYIQNGLSFSFCL